MGATSGFFLRTLGSSALIGPPQGSVALRAKDLALLVYLCVNGPGKHTRSALATLLWGDRDESHARHSLTQALRHLRLTLADDALLISDRIVDWRGDLPCDALTLERAAMDPALAEEGFPAYGGDFLADLDVGHGAAGFNAWADERRAHFRFAAARVLAAQGSAAESLGRWETAVQLGIRLIEIEPMSQQAHRRVMRAWSALGERALAVRHYHQFERWLRDEWGELPDPATRALYEHLHAGGTPGDSSGPTTMDARAGIPDDLASAPSPAVGTRSPNVAMSDAADVAIPLASSAMPTAASDSTRVRRGFVIIAAVAVLTLALVVIVLIAALQP